ncbi:MAG TPA: nucleotide sugar dehydrogenase [Methylomirabilota bacterium]|jgi:UDP-N-acetyl-D-glucosamine dehydrogenase|nr:nucleotide sugar dehydrogenase [Methylomirabilota bacterium]
MTETLERLRTAIEDRSATVGVAGLGYVGLPLAIEFAKAGFRVTGLDPDASRVDAVNRGVSYIGDVRSEDLAEVTGGGRLMASASWELASQLDAIVICVPTPFSVNREPDLSFVRAATEEIARRLRPGQLIVLESTTYPGTTQEVLRPILEAGGLRVGREFCLAYSPERVDPGNPHYHIANTPKLLAGVTPLCTALGSALYEKAVIKVVPLSSPRAAEMAKLLENIFRNVNIALVNELAMLCDRMGLDVWEVVEAAATKPFGFMSFQPGPGVGGHCIPVDPVYLSWKAKEYDFYTNFITLAAEVNANMPYFVVQKLLRLLAGKGGRVLGTRVLVLGVTFKRNVADVRNSPAVKLLELMLDHGIDVAYHDPLVPELEVKGTRLQSLPLTAEVVESADCVILHTDHATFSYDWIVAHARFVFDTRNATREVKAGREKVVRL